MKLFSLMKDGGKESHVSGLYFVEIKSWFTVVLLHFSPGTRDAYHSHAFNALSWVFKGRLIERRLNDSTFVYTPSIVPLYTGRSVFHQVISVGDTWVLSFRGPWVDKWREFLPLENSYLTLTHGRKVVKP